MSDRPSGGMELDELRDEFDWMYEFQSRMAERIRGDADVHSLVDYVGKLESENDKLRELVRDMWSDFHCDYQCSWEGSCKDPLCKYNGECSYENRMHELGIEVDE